MLVSRWPRKFSSPFSFERLPWVDVELSEVGQHHSSLISLAKYPASTVQVLSAEEAPFRVVKLSLALQNGQLIDQSNAKLEVNCRISSLFAELMHLVSLLAWTEYRKLAPELITSHFFIAKRPAVAQLFLDQIREPILKSLRWKKTKKLMFWVCKQVVTHYLEAYPIK